MRCGLVGVEDAQAQQVEAGRTVPLALEHFESVDVTFDRAVTPGLGEVRPSQRRRLVESFLFFALCIAADSLRE